MKKNLYLFVVALFATFALGLSSCSDNVTEIPTTPVEKGTIEIDGVTYVTNLFQTEDAGVSTSSSTPSMLFDVICVTNNNAAQYLQFQCNAVPLYVMEDGAEELVTYKNPYDGMVISDYNLLLNIDYAGPILKPTTDSSESYIWKDGTATIQNVDEAAGTLEINFQNLVMGLRGNDDTNTTFNGVVKYKFSFLAQPEGSYEK